MIKCKKYLTMFFLVGIFFNLTVMASAAEKLIPGNRKMEDAFRKLGIEKEFHLYVTDGYQAMANGEDVYIWGYAHAPGFADVGEIKTREERDAKLLPVKAPGDEIRFTSGKNYIIAIHNAGWYETEEHSGINHVAHTIHFHGLDLIPDVDGIPDLPYPSVFPGEVFRYLLTIPKNIEGSYMGHCHVDSTNHIMAGMYFPLIIEKKPNKIYGYKFDREYTIFLSEFDSEYMEMLRDEGSIRKGLDWKANYFLMNGRIFTDKLDNPLSTINDPKTRIVAYDGETVLVRLMAIGYDHIFVWHPHGYHGLVVGTDGRKLKHPYEKDSIRIGSGERFDILYKIPKFSSKTRCLSCNLGAGISIAHDHNLRGMVSQGIYPHGPLTIFDVRTKPKSKGTVLKRTVQKVAQVFKK
jgi:FtsP/CotA-like multicopper oxidase with cupredoxin domain